MGKPCVYFYLFLRVALMKTGIHPCNLTCVT